MNERAWWREREREGGGREGGLVDAKIASSVELLGETLDFGREAGGGKVKAEREGARVQGHALSQIINFSPLGES